MWRKTVAVIDMRWLLLSFAVLLIAATWSLTLFQLNESKRLQTDDAGRDAQALARLFREHATRTLEAADQAVIFLRKRYNSEGLQLDVAREVREGLGPGDNIYNQFSIADEHADLVLSSLPFKPVNLADREHIRVHMQAEDGQPYISKPVLGRVSNKWSLQLTRGIRYPDGRFKGVVVVSMDPQYFTRLYHDVDVGHEGSVALVGNDGVIRVRRVGADDSQGQDISGSAVFAAMRARHDGTVTLPGPIDGRTRIYAFQRLERFPLYALVGIDIEERMQRYAAQRARALGLAVGATVVIVLFALGLYLQSGQLIQSRAHAIAANLAKSRFLSNMSHELRTPLNGILGYSELLQNELGEGRSGGFAGAIHNSGMRLLALIEAVLELSALESGRENLQIAPLAMADLPQLTLARHQDAAAAKGLALTAQLDPALPDVWPCDHDKLLRIIDILLLNAVAATPAGAVTLTLAPAANGGLRLEVRDTGRGVPPEQRRHIFEKFAQADDTVTRGKQGAGLGLAIASQLTRLMRGRIWLDQQDGAGAVFAVELPAQQSGAPASRGAA